MSALTGPALVAAALLVLAGSQKLLVPDTTVGALRALGLPAGAGLVRVGAAAELALGLAAVVTGGPVVWALVALSYLAFAAFVTAALRAGTMIGSCGCFGRDETPPHPSHVGLNLGLAGVAVIVGASMPGAIVDQLARDPAPAVAVVAVAAFATYLLFVAFVLLPRTLVAARDLRSRR